MNKLYELLKMHYNGDLKKLTQQRISTMLPLLNERQRRLFLACEARALGFGGITEVSRIAGVARITIKYGLRELENAGGRNLAAERSRKSAPSKKKIRTRFPNIMHDLKELIDPAGIPAKGDAEDPLQYTSKSAHAIAEALKEKGLIIGASTIYSLLKEEGYSLRRKWNMEGLDQGAEEQFKYINKRAKSYMKRGEAVLFIDLKEAAEGGKKAAAPLLYDAAGLKKALGKGGPADEYRLFRKTGLMSVSGGETLIPLAFNGLRRWWKLAGAREYERTRRILIAADLGGGTERAAAGFQKLADEWGKELTVLHFPLGTTKWQGAGYRFYMFAGQERGERPPVKAAAIISQINGGNSGLELEYTPEYRGGQSGEEDGAVNIKRHEFRGEWNYTVIPKRRTSMNGPYAELLEYRPVGDGAAWEYYRPAGKKPVQEPVREAAGER